MTANQVRPGERNPIEGKFGQAKTGYGLNNIKARLKNTSETWIACIFLVLNLVKLAGKALPCLLKNEWIFSFSAQVIKKRILQTFNNFEVCVLGIFVIFSFSAYPK